MNNSRNRPLLAITLATLLALGAGTAMAQGAAGYVPVQGAYRSDPPHGYSATSGIDQRQAQQQRRIYQGARSGQLTRHEARRLEHQQVQIHRMERRARADGIVTRNEQRQINQAQRRANQSIYREKHDGQRYR